MHASTLAAVLVVVMCVSHVVQMGAIVLIRDVVTRLGLVDGAALWRKPPAGMQHVVNCMVRPSHSGCRWGGAQ